MSLSLSRRSKVARVVGMLALHTTELQENVPVIEVIFFITDALCMAGTIAVIDNLAHSAFSGLHWTLISGNYGSPKTRTLGLSVALTHSSASHGVWPLVGGSRGPQCFKAWLILKSVPSVFMLNLIFSHCPRTAAPWQVSSVREGSLCVKTVSGVRVTLPAFFWCWESHLRPACARHALVLERVLLGVVVHAFIPAEADLVYTGAPGWPRQHSEMSGSSLNTGSEFSTGRRNI